MHDLLTHLPEYAGRGLTLSLFLIMASVAGCGGPKGPPLDQATYHFQRGQFDAAMKVIDQSVPQTSGSEEIADLLALKGRCYWELANREEGSEPRASLLQRAIDVFTESIETHDNAEARHVRAMVYEQTGKGELAAADKTAARELDDTYRRAYINEKPEKILLQQERREEPDEPGQESSVDSVASDSSVPPWNGSTPGTVEGSASPEEGSVVGDGEIPWTRQVPGSATRSAPSATARSRSNTLPGAARSEQDRGKRTPRRPLDENELVANDTLPDAESGGDTGSNSESAEANPPPEADPPPGSDPPAPPVPRIPGSTWQPLAPPVVYDNRATLPNAPSTGIVGPDFGAPAANVPAETAPFGSQPTTGITGPSQFQRPWLPPTNAPTAPTTGIGAGPLNTALPSGIPAPFGLPQSNNSAIPRLPYTGALPPQFQPKGVTPGLGPAPPPGGPGYGALRPSPLTGPPSAGGRPLGIPNVSTSPLVPPTISRPPSTVRPGGSVAPRVTPTPSAR